MNTTKIELKESYTTSEIAFIFGITRRDVCRKIDQGLIPAYNLPGSRIRRVLLNTIKEIVKSDPNLRFVLTRIDWSPIMEVETK